MRRCLCLSALLWLALVFCSPALGADAAESGPELSPKMVLAQAIFDIIWKAAIPLLFAWLAKKGYDEKILASARTAVEMGVTHAYENFVRPLKKDEADHPDGKLKEDERGDAKTWATNKALEFASGGGKRLLMKWGAQGIGNLIEKIIVRRKKGKQKNDA